MKFPFLFHFNANIGPLCCPKVLARLPNIQKRKYQNYFKLYNLEQQQQQQQKNVSFTIFSPYSGKPIV